MKYIIMVDWYIEKHDDVCITEPRYFGLQTKYKIFVFQPEITNDTVLFDLKEDAEKYIKKHFSDRTPIQYTNIRIINTNDINK